MDRRNLAFDRVNFILLGIGFAIVIIGFILMSGPGSTETTFDPDIFSTRRIKVAPVVCFVGFISMIYAIIRKPKSDGANELTEQTEETAPAAEDAIKKVSAQKMGGQNAKKGTNNK